MLFDNIRIDFAEFGKVIVTKISLTMNTYAHVMPAMKQDAMDLMESILTSGK